MTSSSRSAFCTNAASLAARREARRARGAENQRKPLAVRPDCSDDMNRAFHAGVRIAPGLLAWVVRKGRKVQGVLSDPALALESIDIVLDLGRE